MTQTTVTIDLTQIDLADLIAELSRRDGGRAGVHYRHAYGIEDEDYIDPDSIGAWEIEDAYRALLGGRPAEALQILDRLLHPMMLTAPGAYAQALQQRARNGRPKL